MHSPRISLHHLNRAAGLILVLVTASACSTLPTASPDPVFKTVAVVTRGESAVDLEAASTMDNAVKGGAVGAVSAGAIGTGAGAAAGVGGGPLAVITMPAFAAFGAAAGILGGGTVGAIVGGLQGLPAETAERVTHTLLEIRGDRDYQAELRVHVEALLPEERLGTTDRSDALAYLEVTELELEQHLSDHLSIRVRAAMTLEWGPDPYDRDSKKYKYEFQTPERHVEEWLADEGALFRAAFDDAVETLTRDMSTDLLKVPTS